MGPDNAIPLPLPPLADIDLGALTDEQLARLADYRGCLAAHNGSEQDNQRLADVWAEQKRRRVLMMLL